MKRLFNFLEKMNPECQNVNTLVKSGCRIDNENGIKFFLGLNNLASCDYFIMKKNSSKNIISLIEFTDLKRQKTNLENSKKLYFKEVEKLLDNNDLELIKSKIRQLKEDEIKRIILQEIRKKAVESIIIFFSLGKKFKIKSKNIIYSEFNLNIIMCKPFEDPIFIDYLKLELNNMLRGIINKVEIISLENNLIKGVKNDNNRT
jgi:hypothetical protein